MSVTGRWHIFYSSNWENNKSCKSEMEALQLPLQLPLQDDARLLKVGCKKEFRRFPDAQAQSLLLSEGRP